ncbi:MAG: CTP-dependent riboflavin kinase [Candidatus Aenigmarchaeota archaeon]|nr:CTP-dependent riboflavin kinase [Candidatus Aenigmarchaeota archaeon]
MDLTGTVVQGLGEGAAYVRKYDWRPLGFAPYPGTLNLHVALAPDLSFPITIPAPPGLHPVDCRLAKVNRRVDGAVVRPRKTAHGKQILEILAPVNLRETLDLRDGDQVMVSV